jgi:hypothetical protein
MVQAFPEMGLKALLELKVICIRDHVGQRLHDLVLGVVDVLQGISEQVLECLDVFAEDTHVEVPSRVQYG